MDTNTTRKTKEQEENLRERNVALNVFSFIYIFSLLYLYFMLLITSLFIGLKS